MPTPPPLPPAAVQPIEYAVPAAFAPAATVHREGVLIVTPTTCHLPAGCVKCGEPETTLLTKKLSWHHPGLYVLIFFPGLLIYAIVAMIVRKQGTVTFGLCDLHARRRRRQIAIGAIGAVGSLTLGIAAIFLDDARVIPRDSGPLFLCGGIIAMIAFLIVLALAMPVLKPKLIDVYQMKLGGAGARYLDTLVPDVPVATVV